MYFKVSNILNNNKNKNNVLLLLLLLLLFSEFNLIRRNKCDSIKKFILTTRASAHLLLHNRKKSRRKEVA